MKKFHQKASFVIRAALVAAAVAVHSAFADTPDEILDCVQTDGSAYIDTGIIGKAGTKASIGMMWNGISSSTDVCFLGARNGSDGRFLLCHAYKLGWNLGYKANWNNPSSTYTPTLPANNVHYAIMTEITSSGYFNFTVNGTSGGRDTTAQGAYNSGFTMYLFANHGTSSGSVANKCPSGTRCYWTKIWQQDANGVYQFVRDFVPCKKGDRVGLWDRVSGEIFYPVTGTGTLTAGSTVAVHAEPDKTLEYVESDGTQYIDTGVIGRDGTKAQMALEWTQTPPTSTTCDWCFLGSYGDGKMFYLFRWLKTGSYTAGIYTGYNGRWGKHGYSPPTDRSYEVISEVTTGGTYKMSHSGHDQTWDYTANAPVNTGCNLYLFARDNAGTADNFMPVRCYGVKIWQTDTNGDYQLVRDFIPCIKDGKAGLFDKVSNMVYFSLGANDFSAEGARVLSARGAPDKFLKYVASTGEQYIDTGVVGRDGTKAEIDFKFNELGSSSIILLGADKSDPWMDNIKFYLLAYRSVNGTITDGYEKRYNQTFDATTDRCQVISEVMAGGTFKTTINGRTVTHDYTTDPGPYNSGLSLYLFTNNRNGAAGALSAKARCYGLKIWQTDANGDYQPVRDYKPCLKDGRAGLYDEVSDTVYFSLSTTDFVAPPKGVMVIVE